MGLKCDQGTERRARLGLKSCELSAQMGKDLQSFYSRAGVTKLALLLPGTFPVSITLGPLAEVHGAGVSQVLKEVRETLRQLLLLVWSFSHQKLLQPAIGKALSKGKAQSSSGQGGPDVLPGADRLTRSAWSSSSPSRAGAPDQSSMEVSTGRFHTVQ